MKEDERQHGISVNFQKEDGLGMLVLSLFYKEAAYFSEIVQDAEYWYTD